VLSESGYHHVVFASPVEVILSDIPSGSYTLTTLRIMIVGIGWV